MLGACARHHAGYDRMRDMKAAKKKAARQKLAAAKLRSWRVTLSRKASLLDHLAGKC
jgi:hypothetical protein